MCALLFMSCGNLEILCTVFFFLLLKTLQSATVCQLELSQLETSNHFDSLMHKL